MASNSSNKPYPGDTTFIQTDPSNFKSVVHKLTGLRQDKKPGTTSPAGKSTPGEMGPRKPAFKLHERRQSARKLEIMLQNRDGLNDGVCHHHHEKVMVSPVSPFGLLLSPASGSPRSSTPSTPRSSNPADLMDEEMRGILENGFYIHPSPSSSSSSSHLRSGSMPAPAPPRLLSLFPVNNGRGDSPDDSSDN
ncbi:OLC1v1037514C1 [Oldenlandia corymbosa var. corymbosa]|uniref:OLC1v1037514C1 n=1 Tax=Oldenlandia corymbosa var. corymbosa TaxID=529605 RepID=A0AAV1E1I0_OLDCO|nr:OLC1v1037514C1 [Oldenlandia corymbosa var. corymbosa]